MVTKCCRKCNVTKPITEFGVRMVNKDGRHTRCLECIRIYAASMRRFYKRKGAGGRVVTRERNPEQARAHRILSRKVWRGQVKKPSMCEDCGGQFEKAKLHGHHEDYSKPLDVVWLCVVCHAARHRQMRGVA